MGVTADNAGNVWNCSTLKHQVVWMRAYNP